jgi:CDP-diacylglycerol--serine O-phosphatidyltransferase
MEQPPIDSESSPDGPLRPRRRLSREERRLRLRRRGKRAYIQSVYFLPSLATLGNAVCGFASMYIAMMVTSKLAGDSWAQWLAGHGYSVPAYLIFLAMVFDGLDGRLARYTRHTTDFGGQLDSLADMISFGAAPAFLSLLVFKTEFNHHLPAVLSKLIWAIGALFMSCAALRLARFNVSNEHGEQHHFSFLGLPSPGAAGAIAGLVLMQQELHSQAMGVANADHSIIDNVLNFLSASCVAFLPVITLLTAMLMVSEIRYPHLVNRYLRGKRPLRWTIPLMIVFFLLFVIAHQYVLGVCTVVYALAGAASFLWIRLRRRGYLSRPTGAG